MPDSTSRKFPAPLAAAFFFGLAIFVSRPANADVITLTQGGFYSPEDPYYGSLTIQFTGTAESDGYYRLPDITAASAVYTSPVGSFSLTLGIADLTEFSYTNARPLTLSTDTYRIVFADPSLDEKIISTLQFVNYEGDVYFPVEYGGGITAQTREFSNQYTSVTDVPSPPTTPTDIPEPPSFAGLLIGIFGCAIIVRTRRSAARAAPCD